ncbi:MAG: DUF6167 family protein [Actinomycetota bacterium]|nr:DUF6167 family protein [Actinomycetota bacterium]
MSRGLWFVAGAGAGIYAMVRGRRAAEAFTADGMRDRLGAAGVGLRMFRDEVAQGKAEAETHLRERLGLVPHGVPELGSAPKHRAPDTERQSGRPDGRTAREEED